MNSKIKQIIGFAILWATFSFLALLAGSAFAQAPADQHPQLVIHEAPAAVNAWMYDLTANELNIFAQEKDRWAGFVAQMGDSWASLAKQLHVSEAFLRLYQCPTDIDTKPMAELKPGDPFLVPFALVGFMPDRKPEHTENKH